MSSASAVRYVVQVGVLAAVYFAAAKAGLLLARRIVPCGHCLAHPCRGVGQAAAKPHGSGA